MGSSNETLKLLRLSLPLPGSRSLSLSFRDGLGDSVTCTRGVGVLRFELEFEPGFELGFECDDEWNCGGGIERPAVAAGG